MTGLLYIAHHQQAMPCLPWLQEKIEEAHQKKKDVEDRIKAMAGDTDTLEPRRAELKKQYLAKKQVMRTHAESLKQVQLEIARQEKDRRDMQNRINDLQARCVRSVDVS